MKTIGKFLACVALMTLVPGAALAACGVGNKIWEGRSGIVPRVLAFTTNFWTFKGISTTFEILGCTEQDNWLRKGAAKATSSARVRHFANQNLDHLAVEMARGNGEHLDALGLLIELHDQDQAAFRSLVQDNFEALFPHDDTTAGEMLSALDRLMGESPDLAHYVES